MVYNLLVMKSRYLTHCIQGDLQEKMVFLGGARQVGKTTFARELIGTAYSYQYYNWDQATQRREALGGTWPPNVKLIILDEFHKFPKWKTWIKGEYDSYKNRYHFLLTGSARLNIYRRGGDSLQGRYHFYHLHPFSLAELSSSLPSTEPGQELQFKDHQSPENLHLLLQFGGFPEPLIKQNDKVLRRWHSEYVERLLKEDIRDLTQIQNLTHLSLLADLLPERVSSVLSINSLANDLQVNHRTIQNWLNTFEHFYYCFRIPPYQTRKISSVRKEKKLYLWDWSQLKDTGARLENLVASHLLKFRDYLHDSQGWKIELYYLRDITGREVDFLISHENKPWFAVEVKSESDTISKNLFYFQERLKIPYCYQITMNTQKDFLKDGIRVMPVEKFLSGLV